MVSSAEVPGDPRPAESGPEESGRGVEAPLGRIELWALWALIGFGVVVRLVNLASRRSLYIDEALLARNICGRDLLGLARPLDLNQAAPVGFLWLVKVCVLLGGCHESALRAVSLAAGLAALPLTFLVARRLLGVRAATMATAIVAVSPSFVYYSSECKQYMLDATIALAIVHVALRFAAGPRSTARGLTLALVGAIAVWASHPAVFVLAASALWLLTATPVRSDARVRTWALVVAAIWGLSFAIDYLVMLRPVAASPFLRDYWQSAFLRFPPRGLTDLWQYLAAIIEAFEAPLVSLTTRNNGGARAAMLAIALAAYGAAWLWRRDRRDLVLLLGPYALALIAALLGKYPAQGRLILFALPFLVMLVADGVARAVGRAPTRALGLVLFSALLLYPVLVGVQTLKQPSSFGEVRPAIEHVARHRSPQDAVWVYHHTDEVVRFYQEYGGLLTGINQRVVGSDFDRQEDLSGQLAVLGREVDALAGRRIWLLLSNTHSTGGQDHGTILLTLLEMHAQLRDKASFDAASVYLFEVPASPQAPPMPKHVP